MNTNHDFTQANRYVMLSRVLKAKTNSQGRQAVAENETMAQSGTLLTSKCFNGSSTAESKLKVAS